jgi:hypothetical protein
MSKVITDTLVLKLEEYDSSNHELDTVLYIFYDSRTDHYVIRGKRIDTLTWKSHCYSFECEVSKIYDLIDFIQLLIDKGNYISFTLYNYDNLPEYSNDVTYEFLKENDDVRYEIVGYDKLKPTRSKFVKYLRVLRSVFNYY